MKYLNLILFAGLLHFAHSRVQLGGDPLPKLNRRLADTEGKKIKRTVTTRAAKNSKVAKRKLLNGTAFGLVSGLGGFGMSYLGRQKQRQEINLMRQQLDAQRMELERRESDRDDVIERIRKQVDENEASFADYKRSLLQGLRQFATIIKGKLEVYSAVPTRPVSPVGLTPGVSATLGPM